MIEIYTSQCSTCGSTFQAIRRIKKFRDDVVVYDTRKDDYKRLEQVKLMKRSGINTNYLQSIVKDGDNIILLRDWQ